MSSTTNIFVSVGTDHHPFDRLVEWVDRWDPPESGRVRLLVQYGRSRPPGRLPGTDYLTAEQMHEAMRQADVVVTQGGPGGIMDARRAGVMPIVVPRTARLGEHVDDHQQAFARHLQRLGKAITVNDEGALHAQLSTAALEPSTFRIPPDHDGVPTTTLARFEEEVARLMVRPAGPWWRRIGTLSRTGLR